MLFFHDIHLPLSENGYLFVSSVYYNRWRIQAQKQPNINNYFLQKNVLYFGANSVVLDLYKI